MSKKLLGSDSLVDQISELIEKARQQIQRNINTLMVQTYWQIGCLIVEDEQQGNARASYGKAQLEQLSEKLTERFGKGFDMTNLRNMRRFYQAFPIRDAVRLELSWTHYRVLLRVEKQQARDWYAKQAIDQNWSARALERQIDTYIRIYDQHKKDELDNPTIGLVLCSHKSEAIVKYSVLTDSQQLFAAKYMDYLPSEEELKRELEREVVDVKLASLKKNNEVAR